MSKENVEIVRRLFEAVEKRDGAGVLGTYDENIVIREAASLPYGGEYRGLEGALRHAQGYRRAWDKLQTSNEQKLDAEFFDAGDSVIVRWRQKAVKGDEKLDLQAVSIYKMRDGKIAASEMFQDTAAVLRFLNAEQEGNFGAI